MGASESFDAERRARFEAVFSSAYEPMQRYVRRRGGGSDTDDIVADAFGAVWRRLDDAYRLRTGQAGGFKILAPLTIQMLIAARRVADTLYLRFRR